MYSKIPLLIILLMGCTSQVKEDTTEPLNVILLIGDGMGLSQMSSAFYYKDSTPALKRFTNIGLAITSSSSHKITDSAAGATAYSCGIKTYNGAIGVDSDSVSVRNITEILAESGYVHGLISTSSITHATPASFFAHTKSRSYQEEIAAQLHNSHISFFAGGGIDFFNKREDGANYLDSLAIHGFQVDTTQLSLENYSVDEKYGYLLAGSGLPPIIEGRDDFLARSTSAALQYLELSQNGFFLMVEGSQIDWGGHDNNANYLIGEMLDFDLAIEVALDYADANKNTLILVTADHETGGFTLAPKNENGRSDYDTIVPRFSVTDHSATLVPVLAYGKGAANFNGIYQNNELFALIFDSINRL